MTEQAIASAVGTRQSTINRIRKGTSPSYDLGKALVELAEALPPSVQTADGAAAQGQAA